MKFTICAALLLSVIGCERTGTNSNALSDIPARQTDDPFGISKAYMDDIKKRGGTVLIDAVIQPDERIDVPKFSSYTRIGVCVDRKASYSEDKGFVSLMGSDGAFLSGDCQSEYGRLDGSPVTASFVLHNESRNPRRAIVYVIQEAEQDVHGNTH